MCRIARSTAGAVARPNARFWAAFKASLTYIEQGNVDLDAEVTVAVFHDNESADEYPATMVSAGPGNAVNIYADAKTTRKETDRIRCQEPDLVRTTYGHL